MAIWYGVIQISGVSLHKRTKTLTAFCKSQTPCGFALNSSHPILTRFCGGFPWAFDVRRAASGRGHESMTDARPRMGAQGKGSPVAWRNCRRSYTEMVMPFIIPIKRRKPRSLRPLRGFSESPTYHN